MSNVARNTHDSSLICLIRIYGTAAGKQNMNKILSCVSYNPKGHVDDGCMGCVQN